METLASVQHYATELRAARTRRRWSQAELAKRSGMSPNTISRLENARREPRIGQIVALAEVLEVPAHVFVLDTTKGSKP
jgi:transcriptional regulator with XRE-family HTH domain